MARIAGHARDDGAADDGGAFWRSKWSDWVADVADGFGFWVAVGEHVSRATMSSGEGFSGTKLIYVLASVRP